MSKRTMAIARATGMIGATAALVVGVTFAALTSNTATLSANSIASTTASLKISNGGSFGTSAAGFTVTNLVPGTGSSQLPFYLQNDGSVPLAVSVRVPAAPSAVGFTGWENLKVSIKNDYNDQVTETTMQALLAGDVVLAGNPLTAGATGNGGASDVEGNFFVKFDIAPASISGSTVSVGNFDLVFTGTQP